MPSAPPPASRSTSEPVSSPGKPCRPSRQFHNARSCRRSKRLGIGREAVTRCVAPPPRPILASVAPGAAIMSRPFEGIRIIDITHVLAGPFAAYQLGLMGADVIKVEHPDDPDQSRDSGS